MHDIGSYKKSHKNKKIARQVSLSNDCNCKCIIFALYNNVQARCKKCANLKFSHRSSGI